MEVERIINHVHLNPYKLSSVSGGDINDAYSIDCGTTKYFLKINDAISYPNMFVKEANGLSLLNKYSSLTIPKVVQVGQLENTQYILLSWIEKGVMQKDFSQDFGKAIAEMHRVTNTYFGLEEDNYMGSLTQINTPHDTWPEFYANCRIMPLVKQLYERKVISSQLVHKAAVFCKKLPEIFPNEPPALLHGDLWSGNYMIVQNGNAAIYDPAVYYGHREMDIGFTKLFGGFEQEFYNGYNECYALEKSWEQRLPYTQLYPLLVHALLFNGHYINAVTNIIGSF